MKLLAPDVMQRLRDLLLRCGPFEESEDVRSLFVDQRLLPWRFSVPDGDSPAERVDLVVELLIDQYHDQYSKNALVLFLEALQDRLSPGDACRRELARIAELIARRPDLREVVQAASQNVVLYETPPIMARPKALFGRDAMLAQLAQALAAGERVLLYGMAGSGKTALAAVAAEQYLVSRQLSVIWLECRQMPAGSAFDELARRLGTEQDRQTVHLATGDADRQAVRAILSYSPGYLLVLDNMWSGDTLYDLLPAIPETMPLLVTARTAFAFGFDQAIAVEELPMDAALALLGAHARQDLSANGEAQRLCARLGYHAQSLEIAGSLLKVGRSVSQLLRRAEQNLFLELPGRENVEALLDEMVQLLDEQTRRVFTAVGALAAPGTTPEFLAAYLQQDVGEVWEALDRLAQHSLARNVAISSPDGEPEQADFYRFHDLTFRYMQLLHRTGSLSDPPMLTRAAITYLSEYGDQFDHVNRDLPNILAAARLARDIDENKLVEIVSRLVLGGYADTRGYNLELLALLDVAIVVVRRLSPDTERLHYLLGKRGNAYLDRGEPEKALEAYEEALLHAPETWRSILLLSILGRVCTQLGQHDRAQDYFTQAHTRVEAEAPELLRLVLEQESLAAAYREDYALVQRLAEQGIELSIAAGDRLGEAHFRNNLGSAYLVAGGDPQQALHHHETMLALARGEDDHFLQAVACLSLAQDYDVLHEREKAREYLDRADRFFHALGNVEREVEVQRFRERHGYGAVLPPPPGAERPESLNAQEG
jgi:tetratricopeptide (TPR) repeat protein